MSPVRWVGGPDLGRARFSVSPLWEAVAGLRVLGGRRHRFHEQWAAGTRAEAAAAGLDLSLLLALVPPTGHLADILTPTPRRRVNRIDTELAAVARTDAARVAADLVVLRGQERVPTRIAVLDRAARDPAATLAAAVEDLRAWWELAIAPVWPRLRSLAEADIAWRTERIAAGGSHEVLGTLHPRVRMRGTDLRIESTCGDGPLPAGRGLVLVPSAFAWPHLLLYALPGQAPTLAYAPRGTGTVWERPGDRDSDGLDDLVGATRSRALRLLDLPMTTTELSRHLGVGAPTTNSHLKVLHRTGLVRSHRVGRLVHYARTPLGDDLAGAARGEDPAPGAVRRRGS